MYLSVGNIASGGEVGLLLVDFERPHRMRVQGRAELSRDPDLLPQYKEAELVVKVAVRAVSEQEWIGKIVAGSPDA